MSNSLTPHYRPDIRAAPTYTLYAKNEGEFVHALTRINAHYYIVILSAGTVGTPQILQLSGIGSETYLQSLGITPVLNLPGVGQNLQDQPVAMFQYNVNGSTMNPFLNDPSQIEAAFAQYEAEMTGTFASSCLINTVGFLRIPPTDSIWKSFPDPAIGPNSPHYVFAFVVRTLFNIRPSFRLTRHCRTPLVPIRVKPRQRPDSG